MVACQSDKVAASRAMTQNKQLKEQLEELESAVVHLVTTDLRTKSLCDTIFDENFTAFFKLPLPKKVTLRDAKCPLDIMRLVTLASCVT